MTVVAALFWPPGLQRPQGSLSTADTTCTLWPLACLQEALAIMATALLAPVVVAPAKATTSPAQRQVTVNLSAVADSLMAVGGILLAPILLVAMLALGAYKSLAGILNTVCAADKHF